MPDFAKAPVQAAPIAFIDLQAQRARIAERVDAAIGRVLAHGAFVMGPEVAELERRLARHSDTKHVVTCSSGTAGLLMCLLAQDIGRGDAVFVPSFTFTATAEVVVLAGATPVFVDVLPDTFNMDPASLERAVAVARQTGLKPTCVIPVDLFGQPTDIAAITQVAEAHKLWILNDAAQSYGATYRGKRLGSFGGATATSFYPTKPLSCYGDGGAVFTDDDDMYRRLVQVRVHGQGRDRNDTVRIGLTGRLDSIQAAILLEKLAIFDDECAVRDAIATRYTAGLKDVMRTPTVTPGATSVWHQYTICSPRRDRIVTSLNAKGIATQVYYPKPIHVQPPYKGYPVAGGGLPVTEQVAQDVVSLPLHPYLSGDDQDRVIAAVRAAVS